jgi:hypothetical protein
MDGWKTIAPEWHVVEVFVLMGVELGCVLNR